MKTKHILTAMALPALFAACTADDIVSENNGLQQDQRAKLSKDFVLNVNNEVESRYAVEGSTELKFVFAEGDKIGANLIDVYNKRADVDLFDPKDPATWEIIKTVSPALPFIYEGGVWKSANEDLGIGNYLFTNPFNPADKNRAAASYELPVVVHYSSENPNAHIEAYNKAVAAQITYEGQTSANADLKNIFAYPMIRINFDKNLEVKKVTKVVLAKNYWGADPTDNTKKKLFNGAPFIYKGAFNHQDVADMFNQKKIQKWLEDNKAYKYTEEDYWASKQTSDFIIDEADYDVDGNGTDETNIEGVIEAAKTFADIKTTPYFIYEMDETVVANSIDVRFMIPSIENLDETLIDDNERITMYVCTDKGNFEMELTDLTNYQFSPTTLAALKNAAMQRNTSYTLKTTTGALVSSSNATIFFNNIVSTAADWNKLVEEYGDLRKYSAEYNKVNASGEKVNKDAQEMIVNIISDKFALTSDLKMPEVAEFIIKSNVNVEGEVALKNIEIRNDAGQNNKLIVKDGAVLTTDPTLEAPFVEVEKGGELVFAAEYNEDEELVAYDAIETVHNHGTVTVPAGVIAEFTLQNADKEAVLNVGAAASRAAEVAEAKAILAGYNYGVVNNYSVIDAVGFTNEAAAEKNDGEETGYKYDTEAEEWNGTPTVKNLATFNAKGSVANKGLFENHSVLTSNFVGAASFANTGVLDIKSGAETYIDNNQGGTIILAELTPAKGLTIYKARKNADFNCAKNASGAYVATSYAYRGTIKHTLAGKTTEALDLSASPVNYLVANADVEIGKTYTWTDNSGSTAVTNIYPLETLEVTDGIVTLAARTAGATAGTYVYPAQVANLIVNGEVDIDGEMYSPMIEKLTVNAGGVFGVPAESLFQILLADIDIKPSKVVDEKTLAEGKVSVVGTLVLEDRHPSSESATVWPNTNGVSDKYDRADFDGKNIEINKDAEVKCNVKEAASVGDDDKDELWYQGGTLATFKTNVVDKVVDSNDTYSLIINNNLAMDYSYTVSGADKTNADYVSILTTAKSVTLKANLTGLKEGTAVTTLNKLVVDGKVTISGSKNVNILKVKELEVKNGSNLNIEGGYLVIDEVAVKGKGSEKINIQGVYNSRIIAYNSDDEMLYWDNAKSEWTDNANFTHDNSEVTLTVSTAEELSQAVENGVGNITLSNTVNIEDTWNVAGEMAINMGESNLTGYINVDGNGDLTIRGGKIVNNLVDYSGITSNGELVLNDVEVESVRHALRVESGIAEINGGEYTTVGANGKTTYALNVGDAGKIATVTINDGVFVGPADNANSDSGSALGVKAGSEVTVNGGEFSKGKVSTILCSGTVEINDGTIYGVVTAAEKGELTINKGIFFNETKEQHLLAVAGEGKIVVNGGLFYNFNPAVVKSGNSMISYLAEGSKISKVEQLENGEWKDVTGALVNDVAIEEQAFDKGWSLPKRYTVTK